MNWQLLARANTHPLRISILEVLAIDGGRTLSPSDLSYELRTPLSNVNYHVTELHRTGLVETGQRTPVRGATEHFYRESKGHEAQRKRRLPQRPQAQEGAANAQQSRPGEVDREGATPNCEKRKGRLSSERRACIPARRRSAPAIAPHTR